MLKFHGSTAVAPLKHLYQWSDLLSIVAIPRRPGVGTASTQPAYEELIRRGYTPDLAAILYTPEEFQNTKPIFLDLVEEAILKAGTVEIFVAELVRRYLCS
ncbi:hypothetical protein COMA2_110088 [Candidatus Nitrospira nitrificans]|uniref:Uncharacterized protein n=1 Tax=Candidatus Nitrospira nitrificans TaxID=1742973 RepID=A0A0S4L4U7_9BACT|nr:hypothetical protein COMA2_110088 [Candidatus Nitrospira nitrificans]